MPKKILLPKRPSKESNHISPRKPVRPASKMNLKRRTGIRVSILDKRTRVPKQVLDCMNMMHEAAAEILNDEKMLEHIA